MSPKAHLTKESKRLSFGQAPPLRLGGAESLHIMTRLKTLTPRLAPARQTRAAFQDTAGGAARVFYKSDAFRQWAGAVKARDGYTCQGCGAQGRGVRLIADHIKELKDGGAALDVANGKTLCQPCHNRKSAQASLDRAGL